MIAFSFDGVSDGLLHEGRVSPFHRVTPHPPHLSPDTSVWMEEECEYGGEERRRWEWIPRRRTGGG